VVCWLILLSKSKSSFWDPKMFSKSEASLGF
jgi:hypothetical protein